MKTPLKMKIVIALLACVGFSGAASAIPLLPGVSGAPDVFGSFATDTLVASPITSPFSSGAVLSGSITAAVFRNPTGTLDFVYQVSNNAGSLDAINRVTAINFTGFTTDVGFTLSGSTFPGGSFVDGTTTPLTVDRSLGGGTVGFQIATAPLGILPGATSVVLVIETNATNFAPGHVNVIDGGVTTEPAFQPAAPRTVPDSGATVALLGLALTGLEGVRRILRRR
jgi:hypothetical protein